MKSNYKWSYQNIGGTTRIKLQSGEDIRHLAELDPKMWTVLSCPVQGLEIDSKSLQYIDADGDGKIHVQDVITTANYLCSVLQNPDILLDSKAELPLSEINADTEDGKRLLASAKAILHNLGKEGQTISPADTVDSIAIFAKTRFNGDGIITPDSTDDNALKTLINAIISTIGSTTDRSGVEGVSEAQIEAFYASLVAYKTWQEAKPELPYGEQTDEVLANYNALNDKVSDYFLRQRMAQFSTESAAALDIQVERVKTIAAESLIAQVGEIANQPLARVTGKDGLDLNSAVNPVWAAQFNSLKTIALADKKDVLTEDDWASLGNNLSAYVAWQNAKAGAEVESLGIDTINEFLQANQQDALKAVVAEDKALETVANAMTEVDKLTHLHRDFFVLLKNFVTLQDFYNPNKDTLAIFQAGTLIIDQRACRLCMKVADMGKHGTMASASGMFLIYCDCTTKTRPEPMQIVAAMTQGDTGDLMVGKNCIFYDRNGLDWDAVITKIIDNPISIGQAFWSPYRRMAKFVEDFINKRAAEKDSKLMADMSAKIETTDAAPADPATPKQPFDIAKFAGIFAAFGMAIGAIGTALVEVGKGLKGFAWWQYILIVVGLLLIISAPSMVMAWMKLRRRNIAPLLNANGWAINAASLISIPFGITLTDVAKYPKLRLKDPFKKSTPAWKKWLSGILLAFAIAFFSLWLTNRLTIINLPSPLPCYNVEDVVVPTDSTQIEASTDTIPLSVEQ